MKKVTHYLLSTLLIVGTACGSGGDKKESQDKEADKESKEDKQEEMDKKENKQMVMEKNGLKVSPIETKNFPDAELSLTKPDKMELKPGKIDFNFDVNNYKLKQATPDASDHMLAESDKGQHIHFIVNNGPYMAKYDTGFKVKMDKGHHTVLAFLSRSYHESIKHDNAFVIKQFSVGDHSEEEKADLSKPHLFYSRPKGTYKGDDFKKLLLDFYPVNAKLGKDAHKVKATINGTSFTFTEWKPYVIEGLEAGNLTIKLELLDSEGNLVDSKFNTVTRDVTLEEGEMAQEEGDMEEDEGDKQAAKS